MSRKKYLLKIICLLLVSAFALIGCGSGGDGGDGGNGGGDSNDCGVVDGSGKPAIWFTYVPPYGSYENLKGRVSHVSSESYKVAVYIKVGGWWTKPYWATPNTNIECNGSFVTDVTTGGIDERATEIRAYLIPENYDPPLAYGGALPAEVEANAVASEVATR
jgi:hypothetical protein